jgi:prepilin-type N-terminal cleavage/methylation domain-containing protein
MMKDKGFTLIEVIVAITILFLVVASVFYFYSNLMENQAKLKEKYRILRIGKEWVDSFIFGNDPELLMVKKGQRKVEDFILRWEMHPVEDGREVLFTSGIAPLAQLQLVHLELLKTNTGNNVLDLHFLVNTISPPEK